MNDAGHVLNCNAYPDTGETPDSGGAGAVLEAADFGTYLPLGPADVRLKASPDVTAGDVVAEIEAMDVSRIPISSANKV